MKTYWGLKMSNYNLNKLEELFSRIKGSYADVTTLESIVEEYIYVRKNKVVKLNVSSMFNPFRHEMEIVKLNNAVNHIESWLLKNK